MTMVSFTLLITFTAVSVTVTAIPVPRNDTSTFTPVPVSSRPTLFPKVKHENVVPSFTKPSFQHSTVSAAYATLDPIGDQGRLFIPGIYRPDKVQENKNNPWEYIKIITSFLEPDAPYDLPTANADLYPVPTTSDRPTGRGFAVIPTESYAPNRDLYSVYLSSIFHASLQPSHTGAASPVLTQSAIFAASTATGLFTTSFAKSSEGLSTGELSSQALPKQTPTSSSMTFLSFRGRKSHSLGLQTTIPFSSSSSTSSAPPIPSKTSGARKKNAMLHMPLESFTPVPIGNDIPANIIEPDVIYEESTEPPADYSWGTSKFYATQRYQVDNELLKFLVPVARYAQISQCSTRTYGIKGKFQCVYGCHQFNETALIKQWKHTEPGKATIGGYLAEDSTKKWLVLGITDFKQTIWNRYERLHFTQKDYLPWNFDEKVWNDATLNPAKCGNVDLRTGIKDKCYVHAGSFNVYQRLMMLMHTELDATLKDPKYAGYQLIVTGHSHAGSVAALVGANIKLRGFDPAIVTFGAPKVGNKHWADWFDKLFDSEKYQEEGLEGFRRNFRVTRVEDQVPLLPIGPQYTHTRGEIYLTTLANEPRSDSMLSCYGQQNTQCSYRPIPTNPNNFIEGVVHWQYFVDFRACHPIWNSESELLYPVRDPEDPYSYKVTGLARSLWSQRPQYDNTGSPLYYGLDIWYGSGMDY